jgi:hypothetical protein
MNQNRSHTNTPLTKQQKAVIEKAVKKTVKQHGKTLQKLAKT